MFCFIWLQIYNQNRLSKLISLNFYSHLTLFVNGLTHLKRKNCAGGGHWRPCRRIFGHRWHCFYLLSHFLRWRSADGHRCLVTFVPTGVSGSSDEIIAIITFSIQDFALSLKVYTFAADKTAKCVQMQAKNNFSSSVNFNIFYLAEPNKSVTDTHTF